MADLFASLPQGVFWYPLVAALLVVAVRALMRLRLTRADRPDRRTPATSRLSGYASLISRSATDPLAESELERLCIGMLLQAAGYRGYSIEACRHYMSHGAPEHLVPTLREHLDAASEPVGRRTGLMPERSELVVRELESMTEVP